MCGVAGMVVAATDTVDLAALDRASHAQRHRGPHGAGSFLDDGTSAWVEHAGSRHALVPTGSRARTVALVHRRLAVIDLSAASAQPMRTADDRFVLAWNGALYNFRELAEELAREGVRVPATSDSAVLLHAWAHWGPAALARCTGMYAIAVADRVAGTLTLARDPFGQKPLYTARTARGLSFASELPALHVLTGARARVAPAQLAAFLASGATDAGGPTMFDGYELLPAGHTLTIDLRSHDAPRLAQHWTCPRPPIVRRPADVLAAELRDRLTESVAWHLRSDRPVAVLLSGGTDSSTVTCLARHALGRGADLHTYSYAPDGEAQSEASWARIVNEATGAIAHPVRPSFAEFEAEFTALVRRQGEPFPSPAILVEAHLYRAAAADGVVVVLDGQGADELFGGYRSARVGRMADQLRSGAWKRARRLAAASGMSSGEAARAVGALLGARWVARWRRARGASPFGPLTDPAWMRARGVSPSLPWAPDGGPVMQALQRHKLVVKNIPVLMRWSDRNAMAESVEGRHPFLTPALVEFALGLPDDAIVGDDARGKPLLRRAMRGIVPDAILDRSDKVGFAVPWRPWLAQSSRLRELLAAAARLGGVDSRAAGLLLLALRAGRPLPDVQVAAAWRLAALAAWAEAYDVAFD